MMIKTILIVDDDQETGNLIARYLRGHSFSVGLAPDGREMDRYMAQNRVDLIVLDIMLPGEDGLSLIDDLVDRDRRSRSRLVEIV
ncbi:response regulator [Bradyrhizobium sp. Cp5.3]|uniref:response regulator n=1 Tax=Bradyrhizobium sp. Cp5.3 TaxID=443598 RepID=UPI000486498F|nr:response regulator [Bradyrhizobium sp. Cp5.3]